MGDMAGRPNPGLQRVMAPRQDGREGPGSLRPGASSLAFAIFLSLAMVIGILIARDFGVSTDEPDNARVGEDARKAYQGSEVYFSREALAEHGPIYFMFFTLTSEALHEAFPSWPLQAGRHLTNYTTFLLGVVFFYMVCLRFLRRPYALAASALYFTQPILFGSAFINQKDIPFLTCFLGVIALGWVAADGGGRRMESETRGAATSVLRRLSDLVADIREEWRAKRARSRWGLVIGCLLGLAVLVDLVWGRALQTAAEALVSMAHEGSAPWPLQQVFQAVATDAYKTPIDLYLSKVRAGFHYLRFAAPLVFLLAAIGAGSWVFPALRKVLAGRWTWGRLPALIGSALLLGAAIAIRQIGVFAGALVTIYLLYRARGKGIPPLLLYWAVAACVVYLTWPYLWPDPIGRFQASYQVIGTFSAHHVLYEGKRYGAGEAPRMFLPALMGYQLTESALVLFAIGLVVFARKALAGRFDRLASALLAVWLFIPVMWVVLNGVPIYNNLRHMYFVLPPVFVMSGLGLEALAARSKPVRSRWLLFLCAALPGLVALVLLHPYQYAYFNSFAGGVSGASGRFELDYWCTSLKETTEYVGRTAAPGESLMIFGPIGNAIPYVRQDLILEGQYSPLWKAGIVALCPHGLSRGWDPADFERIHEVRRGEAVLGEVWRRVTPTHNAEVPLGG